MRTSSSPRRVLAALGISVGSFATLQSLLVPVLPAMQVDLGTDTAGITWALTIWLITAAVATPVFGRVGDLVGKRRVLLLSIAAVVLGSVVAALAPNLAVLLIGRVLQGLGGSLFPLAFGLVRDSLPAERVPSGIGVIAALTAIGSGIGTVLAGPLAAVVTWRGIFLVPLVGVSIGALLVARWVRADFDRTDGRINLVAAALLSAGLVTLLLPLSFGGAWGWGSTSVIGLFVLAAILLAVWVVYELRSSNPLVDMRMMRLPGVWNAHVSAILIGATMFGVWAFFARFLQEPVATGYGLGASVTQAGLIMLPMLVLMALAGFVIGPVGRVLNPRLQVVAGSLLVAGSTASIALLHASVWELTVAAAVFGFGLGLVYAALTTVVVQSVPAGQTGIATGMNANLRTIGSGVGTALMTAIVTGSVVAGPSGLPSGEPTEFGYEVGFLVLAGFGLLAAVVAAVARPGRARTTVPEPIAESPLLDAEAA